MNRRNVYHSVDIRALLAGMVTMTKKEQREYALQFFIDLARDDAEEAKTPTARDIILKANAKRKRK